MSVQTETREISDRDVGRRLRRAIRSADTARDDDEYPGGICEWEFVGFVIPALDARGLGEKYTIALSALVWPNLLPTLHEPWFNDEMWPMLKAPLSLRARAALSVLEGNNA